jgi:glycosyltransferase involved in cell wall biosynthesis
MSPVFLEADQPRRRGNEKTVLCVGELTENKNAKGLIQAFSLVTSHIPDARFRFAGGLRTSGIEQRSKRRPRLAVCKAT